MLQVPVPFPHAGCRAFVPGTSGIALPVTVIRHNADGTALVRHDPDPQHGRNASDRDLRGSTGNSEVERGSLFEHREEAAAQAVHPQHRKAGTNRRAAPQARPRARAFARDAKAADAAAGA